VIIFICGNLAGAYHKHLMELALQQTYQDTCNYIKSRIKLEFEKRQQVKCIFLSIPSMQFVHHGHWEGSGASACPCSGLASADLDPVTPGSPTCWHHTTAINTWLGTFQ